ncbi:hypothetical protein UFOVP5_52 [uncultured Caudovirales phage]|uniref:Uncharacterized protein n=1 Tax=uncultured Caudovirales phage TaxID=2100421 RepID=A0A6J5KH18_9CAUD|nr:hypothetical protein UFOVP5_52 [uncultured Caudovirales phage]
MSAPKPPPPMAERQAQKLPDNGDTSGVADDIARRRRAMQMTATTGGLGLGASGPAVTTTLGG